MNSLGVHSLTANSRRLLLSVVKLQIRRKTYSESCHSTLWAVQDLGRKRRLRSFPLYANEVNVLPQSPVDFHRLLCQRIRNAQARVKLASLYVGTASSELAHSEMELLQALRSASERPDVCVKLLLDSNRALRPVALPNKPNLTTNSADVCYKTLSSPDNQECSVHLLPALSPLLHRLPNPLNEIAGVFHIKAYVIDDEVILSGANLSHEYFTTRIDRYLRVSSRDLVEFYSNLIDALCQYGAIQYRPDFPSATQHMLLKEVSSKSRRRKLQESLETLFTIDSGTHDGSMVVNIDNDDRIVAIATPTFQAPRSYFDTPSILNHERTLQALLQEANVEFSTRQNASQGTLTTRIATAYLNPTRDFLNTLASTCKSYFLTAGRVSHGFAPKKESVSTHENRSRDWRIPNVFVHAAQKVADRLPWLEASRTGQQTTSDARVAFYQRPGWTFHAKGLWLSVDESPGHYLSLSSSKLIAVTHGSGNFGERSASRDIESNLILLFTDSPHSADLVRQHVDEWNQLCDYAKEEPEDPPPLWIRLAFPWIRSFF